MVSVMSAVSLRVNTELAKLNQQLETARAELQSLEWWPEVLEAVRSDDFKLMFNERAPAKLVQILQVLAGLELCRHDIAKWEAVLQPGD